VARGGCSRDARRADPAALNAVVKENFFGVGVVMVSVPFSGVRTIWSSDRMNFPSPTIL
jgi:hypothetical protein